MPQSTNPENYRQLVEGRCEEEGLQRDPVDSERKPDPDFILECLQANELGDGSLYAWIYRGKFILDVTSGYWFFWNGSHWECDPTGKALAAVEGVALAYMAELKVILRKAAQGGE